MNSPENHLRQPIIVVVIQHVAPYMATLYREVSKCLASRNIGFRVLVGSMHQKNRNFGNADDWMHGFDFEYLNLTNLPLLPKSYQMLLPNHRLLRALSHADPALVWAHEHNPMALAASIWARANGRQSILSTEVGDDPPEYATTVFHRHYHQWLKGLYHGTIAVSQEAFLAKNPTCKPRILIPHAVSTVDFSPLVNRQPSDVFRFIFVGSLDARKGVDSLIDAASSLWHDRQDFMVRIVGGGPLAERLSTIGEGWVSLAGHLPAKQIVSEYQCADAFILPSRQDTYAAVVHEAAACGLPLLIGRGAGASRVLVEEGLNGFVIDADDPASIITAMKWMLEHRDQVPTMANAARATAIRFGPEANAARLAAWLDERLAIPKTNPTT